MKKNIFKIGTLLLLCFVHTQIMAQQTKQKREVVIEKEQRANPVKKKKPSTSTKVQRVTIKHKRDSSYKRTLLDVHSKEISLEIRCDANATLFVQNIMRRINIVTATGNKIKLSTTVYYQGDSSFTDEQWFSKLELSMVKKGNNIEVNSGYQSKADAAKNTQRKSETRKHDIIFNGITIFDSSGNWVNRKSSEKRNIVLYVPANIKLDIESKYADVTIENDVRDVKAKITNGALTMANADEAVITSIYGHIYAGNINHATMNLTNGKLAAKNIRTFNITSKNSSVDLDKAGLVKITSQLDQIEIEDVDDITGQKNYGDLKLTKLNGSLDIEGVNADVRIRDIATSVSIIKITNQYANLRLAVANLHNYTVGFEGAGGNVYAPFEKTGVTETSFKASVGTQNANSTAFQLICHHCTIDFK